MRKCQRHRARNHATMACIAPQQRPRPMWSPRVVGPATKVVRALQGSLAERLLQPLGASPPPLRQRPAAAGRRRVAFINFRTLLGANRPAQILVAQRAPVRFEPPQPLDLPLRLFLLPHARVTRIGKKCPHAELLTTCCAPPLSGAPSRDASAAFVGVVGPGSTSA